MKFFDGLLGVLIGLVLLCGLVVIGVQAGIRQGRQLALEELQPLQEAAEIEVRRLNEKFITTLRIIDCESSGRHEVWGDSVRSYGALQFQKPTFQFMAAKAGLKSPHWQSLSHQLAIFWWAFDNGELKHWSCYEGGK